MAFWRPERVRTARAEPRKTRPRYGDSGGAPGGAVRRRMVRRPGPMRFCVSKSVSDRDTAGIPQDPSCWHGACVPIAVARPERVPTARPRPGGDPSELGGGRGRRQRPS